MKKIIGIILILIGVLFIGLYLASDQILGYVSRSSIPECVTAEQMKINNTRAVVNHNEDVDNTEVIRNIINIPKIDHDYVIGQIYIPSRNTNIAIVRGVTNENLLLGAATMKLDQEMGKGNYALAGHYNYTDGVLFNAVYDIEPGTDVYITDKETIWHYRIFSRDIYPDDAFYMLEDDQATSRDNPILTLMTCPIGSSGGTRVFAVGDLVDQMDYEDGIGEITFTHSSD